MVFVDTSAFLALLDADEARHEAARGSLRRLADANAELLTTSYVVHETVSLVQRRLGLRAVRHLDEGLLSVVEVHWIDPAVHRRALAALLAADRRSVSLTDWSSFEVMRARGVTEAFAFDEDFAAQGFRLVP